MMLDIVIVNWNSGKLLSDCIDSIESGNINHVGKVIVVDNNSKKRVVVSNDEFLTSFQEKQMSHQPDFILEYAKYLGKYYNQKGFSNPSVYVDCFVTLNGRLSKRFIKNDIDLLKIDESMKRKNWILPFNDEIQGF